MNEVGRMDSRPLASLLLQLVAGVAMSGELVNVGRNSSACMFSQRKCCDFIDNKIACFGFSGESNLNIAGMGMSGWWSVCGLVCLCDWKHA